MAQRRNRKKIPLGITINQKRAYLPKNEKIIIGLQGSSSRKKCTNSPKSENKSSSLKFPEGSHVVGRPMHLFTVGHSTRAIEDFCELLQENDVQVLVDVRSWPSSKRYPQFNRENLQKSLEDRGIKYVWLGKELGGYRKKGLGEKSPNKAWTSEGFRNYADHTLTQEFMDSIGKLLSIAEKQIVAIMCAEKFYWSCHRRIISDYLTALGHRVTHIIDKGEVREHVLTSFAEIKDGKITYPLKRFQTLNSIGEGGE